MADLPIRLLVAYGLIAILCFAGITAISWARYNSRSNRLARERVREAERYRSRPGSPPVTRSTDVL